MKCRVCKLKFSGKEEFESIICDCQNLTCPSKKLASEAKERQAQLAEISIQIPEPITEFIDV